MNCEYEIHPDTSWAAARAAGGDGYNRMNDAMAHGWFPIPCWGRDGWDLGDWPYVIVYAKDTERGFEVAQDVEGDVTQWRLPSAARRTHLLDALAVYWWRANRAAWLEAVDPDELPTLLGPFRLRPDVEVPR